MSDTTRNKLMVIIRKHKAGLISDTVAYHAICNLMAEEV